MTEEMPSQMRQEAVFEHIPNVLRKLVKANPLLPGTKSEAVKREIGIRYLRDCIQGIGYFCAHSCGHILGLNLIFSEPMISDILA